MLGAVALGAQALTAPAFRIRAAALRPHLRAHGIELEPLPLFEGPEAAGGVPRKAAVVLRRRRVLARALQDPTATWTTALIQRQVDLLPLRSLERLAMRGRRVVLDVDDAIWLDTAPEAGGHRMARLKDSARKVTWLAARADVVVAGNDLLAEWLGRHATAVEVVPSLVDVGAQPVRVHEARQTTVLGWIGSPSTAAYLPSIAPALTALAAGLPAGAVELVVMGGRAPAVPGMTVREEPWSEAGERRLLERMDVGVMPLPDTPWTRGKCAYKALQYMASGVPVVCDAVGISATVVGDGRAGLVAHSRAEWTDALQALVADAGLRARLGAAGRARVAADFSVDAWVPRLAELLRGTSSPAVAA